MKYLIGFIRYVVIGSIITTLFIGFSHLSGYTNNISIISTGIGYIICSIPLTMIAIASFIIPYLKRIKDKLDEKKE
jgi:hypothetical protein